MSKKTDDQALGEKVKLLEKELAKLKRTEEVLQKSEEKYSILVENSLTGIYIDRGGKIVFANDRFAEIYRYPKTALIGMESRELVHPEDRDLTDEIREKRLEGENPPSEYDARGLTRDGDAIWVRRRNTDMEYQGEPAILGNIVDITKEKQAEQELKDFVWAVTHDLKTPIVAVHGFAGRLYKKYADILDEKGRNYLDRIMSSVSFMNALVEDLRSLSKGSEVTADLEEVSSRDIVKEVTSGIREKMARAKEVSISLQGDFPVICCDREKVRQIFDNLIQNAVKYMGNPENPEIEIKYEDKGDFHLFYVKDNGIGIDPKNQQRIFERFQRLKETASEEGTGLGLAIVERMVKYHGGNIWVHSEKGKGANFYFSLPKNPVCQ